MDGKRRARAEAPLATGAGAVEPPPSLRERVIATARGDGFQVVLAQQGSWRPSPRTRGVMLKTLYRPSERAPGTVLLRAPAASDIGELEEAPTAALLIIDGELHEGDTVYEAGDFLPPSGGAAMWKTRPGCTLLVVEGGAAVAAARGRREVVRAHEGVWRDLGAGARIKPLLGGDSDDVALMLLAMSPGGVVHEHEHAGLEEVFLLQGECSSGVQSLRAGDYQRALPGSLHRPTTTGTGCTMVVIVRQAQRAA